MNISIFGLGYVGCVGMGCLAKNGHRIIGVDVNQTKVDFINDSRVVIVEKEIDGILVEQRRANTISATTDGIYAIKNTDISFICVGTPSTANGHLDYTAVYNVAEEIGKGIKDKNKFHVVVIRSTVLPGTNQKIAETIAKISGKQTDEAFATVSNPEFLREGSAVYDYFHPPFSLIGSANLKAISIMKRIYSEVDAPFIVTDAKTAEMVKYVNNAFHALKITFANEIGNICSKIGIDSHQVMDIFCRDKKLNLSSSYLKPGFSYGGSCLPKDLKALRTIAHDFYLECPVLENIEKSNETQKRLVYEKILGLNKQKLGFLGLSFKGGTDDLRNSPIIDIIERLLGKGFDVKIFDQNVRLSQLMGANKEYILTKIPYISKFIVDDPDELLAQSEVLIVVNTENDYQRILEQALNEHVILDLVNIDFQKKNRMKNYHGIA